MRKSMIRRNLSFVGVMAILAAAGWALPVDLGTPTVAYAQGGPEGKPRPKPKPKKVVVKPRVVTKKGKAEGTYNVLGKATRAPGSKSRKWSGENTSKKKLPSGDRRLIQDECWTNVGDLACFGTYDLANSRMLTGSDARAIAVTLVTSLRFPAPKPIFGPDPNNNEWKMLAVGYPVWLWTEGPTTVSTSASAYGFTFRMTARWRSTTFHMGDGKSVTCTAMTRYSASVMPGTASPTCGHVYTKPSLPKGKYQVRAVADWDVSWSVAGFSGVVPAYNEASNSIPIGELVALNR